MSRLALLSPFTLIIILLLYVPLASLNAAEVIVHPSVNIDSITKLQLKRIYRLKQTQWPDSEHIRIFVLASDSPLHKQFCQQKLSLFPYQLSRVWEKAAFTGEALPPQVVSSQQALIEKINSVPGAIGYVSDSSNTHGAKVLYYGAANK